MNCPECHLPMAREDYQGSYKGKPVGVEAWYLCEECGFEGRWFKSRKPHWEVVHDPWAREEQDDLAGEAAVGR